MSKKIKVFFIKIIIKQAIYRGKQATLEDIKSEDNNSTFKLSNYIFCIKFISENFLNLIKFTQKES